MPQIAKQYVDIPMTNYSIELGSFNLIADTLFPNIPVQKRTGIYYEYSKDDLDVSGTDVRAPGASAEVMDYDLTTHTYGPLVDHSLKMKIPIENQENAMDPLDPFRDATRKLTRRAKMYKEADAASKLSDTSKVTQYSTPSALWSDFLTGGASSTPINDFSTAFDTLAKATQHPRQDLTVVLSYPVYTVLIQHPDVIERFKYSQAAIITPEMLANLLQVKEVLVGYAVKKTNVDGTTPDTTDYLWGKNAWVMYRETSPSLYSISGAYTLNMPQVFGPYVMKRWYDTDKESDYMRISYYYQQFIMAPQAIYFFQNVVS